jgi:hypothetical protein
MAEERLGYEHAHEGVEVRSTAWYLKHLSQAHGVLLREEEEEGISLEELTDMHLTKHASASPPSSQVVHAVLHTVTLTVNPGEWAMRPRLVREVVEEMAALRGWVLRGEPALEPDREQGLLLSWLATDHVRGAQGALEDMRARRLRARPRSTEDVRNELLTDTTSAGRTWAQEPDWREKKDEG